MIWTYFILFALTAVVLWAAGAFTAWKERRRVAIIFTVAGLMVFFSYIVMMWITLERPPLRTMGETRLWYSLFLPFAGVIVYGRWRYKWILAFSTTLSTVFGLLQHFQARNTFQDSYACSAESVVCSACNSLHDGLRYSWGCACYGDVSFTVP